MLELNEITVMIILEYALIWQAITSSLYSSDVPVDGQYNKTPAYLSVLIIKPSAIKVCLQKLL